MLKYLSARLVAVVQLLINNYSKKINCSDDHVGTSEHAPAELQEITST